MQACDLAAGRRAGTGPIGEYPADTDLCVAPGGCSVLMLREPGAPDGGWAHPLDSGPAIRYASSMSGTPAATPGADVPAQVFERFLGDLTSAGLPAELVDRLRKTLLVERDLSDRALKAAVLADEPLP